MKNTLLLILFLASVCWACERVPIKPSAVDPAKISTFDTINALKNRISLGSSRLFFLALKRAGLDSLLTSPRVSYTLLIPSDSVFEAASLDSVTLSTMDVALIKNLVVKQIFPGNISDSLLRTTVGYIEINSFRVNLNSTRNSAFFDLEPQGLFVDGVNVTQGSLGVKASNGYIYFIKQFLAKPQRIAYDFIKSRNDLSYYAALVDVADSLQTFSPYNLVPQLINSGVKSTFFIPNNQAFINAGFSSISDLKARALQNYKRKSGLRHFSDTIFYSHKLSAMLSLSDLKKIPYLNDYFTQSDLFIVLTTDLAGFGYPIKPPFFGVLSYKTVNDTILISCNSQQGIPPAKILEGDIFTTVGVVHIVDHLFWPY